MYIVLKVYRMDVTMCIVLKVYRMNVTMCIVLKVYRMNHTSVWVWNENNGMELEEIVYFN